MKQLLTSIILFVSVTAFGQSKQDFFVGATANKMENSDAGIGYSAGFSTRAKLTQYVGFIGMLQFSNYHTKVDDLSLDFYGIEPSFFFTVYPAKQSFSFLVGFTSAFLFDAKLDGHNADITKNTSVFFTPGFSYEITDRFGIIGRYNVPLESTKYFDWTASVGLTIRL